MGSKIEEHPKFLDSEAWAKIRTDIYILRKKTCEHCGGGIRKSFQVHHINYDRYGGDEEPEDLILVHPRCHAMIHGKIKEFKRKKKKRKKIKKVLQQKVSANPKKKKVETKRFTPAEIASYQKNFNDVCPCCGKPR